MLVLASRPLVAVVGVAALAFWAAQAPVAEDGRVMLAVGGPSHSRPSGPWTRR